MLGIWEVLVGFIGIYQDVGIRVQGLGIRV